jgi:molybdate transport system substrate-binding protein
MKLRVVVAALFVLVLASTADAAEIKLLASGATKETCIDLVPAFEAATGNKIVPTWAGTVDIKKKMAAGEVYDVIIAATPEIDAFIQAGKILPDSLTPVMKSAVGVAVRAGAPKPDIGSSDALKKTLLTATSIGYSTGPSGTYVVSLFERMGIADQVKAKLRQVPPGERIGTVIQNGEAEIGFQQVSELIHEPGIQYLGPLPPEVGRITVFAAGVHSAAHEPEAAKVLIKHLTAPAAAAAIKSHGMEPG